VFLVERHRILLVYTLKRQTERKKKVRYDKFCRVGDFSHMLFHIGWQASGSIQDLLDTYSEFHPALVEICRLVYI
jgi:hypothetical protein